VCLCQRRASSVVQWPEFLAIDPQVRFRFRSLPDFLSSSASGTESIQPREYYWEATWKKKSSGSGQENREYGRRHPSRWPRETIHPQKLALTSSTSGGRLVGILYSRTETTEFRIVKFSVKEVCRLWAQPHFDIFNQLIQFFREKTDDSLSEWDQGCMGDVQATSSLNAPAVLEWEQLNLDAHCHVGALHRMSALYAFCSK
jgi:hypothetical protein